jgi:two-component system OmpR family sensor kinase
MAARLSLSFALAAAILLGALGFLVYSLFERSMQENLDGFLRSKADGVVESITTFWQTVDTESNPRLAGRKFDTSEDSPFFEETARLWTKDRAGDPLLLNAAVEILDNKCNTIAASHAIDSRLALPREVALRVLAEGPVMRDIRLDSGAPDQRAFRSLALPVRYGPSIVYVIQVIVTLSRTEGYLARLRAILLLFVPIGFVSAIVAGWAGASTSLRPLRRMIEQIRRIGDHPLGLRLEEPRVAELAELASSFNAMLARVEDSFDAQVDFFNDVSHELKTPLTVLRGEMELALRQDRGVEDYKRTLESGLEEVGRMSKLIEQMLTMARLDSGQVTVQFAPHDLCTLARDVVEGLSPLADAKSVSIRTELPSSELASVDGFRFHQALSSMLDNAIAHAPAGSAVDLSLCDQGDSIRLSVRDRGPGVPPAERAQLFTRFHRGDGAIGAGFGIGLSIAKSVAELHGGRVEYEAAAPGSVFSIVIPKIRAN